MAALCGETAVEASGRFTMPPRGPKHILGRDGLQFGCLSNMEHRQHFTEVMRETVVMRKGVAGEDRIPGFVQRMIQVGRSGDNSSSLVTEERDGGSRGTSQGAVSLRVTGPPRPGGASEKLATGRTPRHDVGRQFSTACPLRPSGYHTKGELER